MNNPILKIVADNPALLDELRKVFCAEFDMDYSQNVDVNKSNEDLGAIVRARLEGLRRVETSFKKILQHKTPPESVDKRNQAR